MPVSLLVKTFVCKVQELKRDNKVVFYVGSFRESKRDFFLCEFEIMGTIQMLVTYSDIFRSLDKQRDISIILTRILEMRKDQLEKRSLPV